MLPVSQRWWGVPLTISGNMKNYVAVEYRVGNVDRVKSWKGQETAET